MRVDGDVHVDRNGTRLVRPPAVDECHIRVTHDDNHIQVAAHTPIATGVGADAEDLAYPLITRAQVRGPTASGLQDLLTTGPFEHDRIQGSDRHGGSPGRFVAARNVPPVRLPDGRSDNGSGCSNHPAHDRLPATRQQAGCPPGEPQGADESRAPQASCFRCRCNALTPASAACWAAKQAHSCRSAAALSLAC